MSQLETQVQQAAARNADLRRTIAETDYAIPALADHRRFLADLQARLQTSDEKRKQLTSTRELKTKDHEKFRDSTMKRFLYKAAGKKDRFAAKAEVGEREYFESLQQSVHEDKLNDDLKEQLNEARNVESQLYQVIERHNIAQQGLDQMYSSIFSGPTPQFPKEDEWEQRSEKAKQAYYDSSTELEAASRAYDLLVKGMEFMKTGLVRMATALSYSRTDMFSGSTMTDMMEKDNLSQAQQMFMQANMAVQQAHDSSPHIKKLPAVIIKQGTVMSNVFFDNILTDMSFHEEIKRAQTEMVQIARSLQAQVEENRKRRDNLAAAAEGKKKELEAARTGLQKARDEAFDRVAREQGIDINQAPPTFEEVIEMTPAKADEKQKDVEPEAMKK